MKGFGTDTAIEGGDGRYTASLAPGWRGLGDIPFGGYTAAIALRAGGAAAGLPRPVSFLCHFLSVPSMGPVDLTVTTLRRAKRAASVRVSMTQNEKPILEALVWFTADGLEGLEHDAATMPTIPPREDIQPIHKQVENYYTDWPKFWRNLEACWEGFSQAPERQVLEPVSRIWWRFTPAATFPDPCLSAARTLVILDASAWLSASSGHQFPYKYIAPNLDLAVHFHNQALEDEWLLTDGFSPVGAHGTIGYRGSVWTQDGRLIASGNAQLLCRPNPMYDQWVAELREQGREV